MTLNNRLVHRPDIVVYSASRLPAGRIDKLTLPPDLVVEVLSSSIKAYDLVTKRDDYQRHGASEYWAIDSADVAIRCWQRRPAGAAVFVEVPIDSTILSSTGIPGLKLDIAALRNIACDLD